MTNEKVMLLIITIIMVIILLIQYVFFYETVKKAPVTNKPVEIMFIDDGLYDSHRHVETRIHSNSHSKLDPIKVGGYILNNEQQQIMMIAYEYGERIGYPETIQAIAMQETHAGSYGDGIGDKTSKYKSYGIMQVKIPTARFVFTHFNHVQERYFDHQPSDEEIIDLLLTNNEANIDIASKNFALMIKYTKNWKHAVLAYNQGLTGHKRFNVDKHYYTQGISHKIITIVRPLNDHFNKFKLI